MFKKFIFFFFLLTLTFLPSTFVQASTQQNLTLGNEVTSYLTTGDDYTIYKITLPSAGRVSVKLNSYISGYTYLKLYNANSTNNEYISDSVYAYSDEEPGLYNDYVDLEKGDYLIKVYKSNSNSGKYTLKADFAPAYNSDIEPNNGTVTANSLTLNAKPIKGFISAQDDLDVFKFTLANPGRITLDLSTSIKYLNAYLYDSNTNQISYEYLSNGNIEEPAKWNDSFDLKAGTYYIKLNKSSYYTGAYSLGVNLTAIANNEVEPINGTATAQKITLSTSTINGYLPIYDDTDIYKFDLSQAGNINLQFEYEVSSFSVYLLNSNNETIYSDYDYYNDYGDNTISKTIYLKPGTYYVKIERGSYTGTYKFKANLLNGWVQSLYDNLWRYYDSSTGNLKTGWLASGGAWYYLDSAGVMTNGWRQVGSYWYYFDNSGAMKTGWLKSGTSWYYLAGTGEMQTGWVRSGNSWYYMNSSGKMSTGWIKLGTTWYYLYSSGEMAHDTTIEGCKLGSDGAWIH